MPRFGIKPLLAAFTVIALWFGTLTSFTIGIDVRSSVMLLIWLLSGFAAVYLPGRRRGFWAAFFLVMFANSGVGHNTIGTYVPDYGWVSPLSDRISDATGYTDPGADHGFRYGIFSTVYCAYILALSMIAGFLTANLYDKCHSNEMDQRQPDLPEHAAGKSADQNVEIEVRQSV